jgi:hypothetical protein
MVVHEWLADIVTAVRAGVLVQLARLMSSGSL